MFVDKLISSYQEEIFHTIKNDWFLITVSDGQGVNMMTAAWGSLALCGTNQYSILLYEILVIPIIYWNMQPHSPVRFFQMNIKTSSLTVGVIVEKM